MDDGKHIIRDSLPSITYCILLYNTFAVTLLPHPVRALQLDTSTGSEMTGASLQFVWPAGNLQSVSTPGSVYPPLARLTFRYNKQLAAAIHIVVFYINIILFFWVHVSTYYFILSSIMTMSSTIAWYLVSFWVWDGNVFWKGNALVNPLYFNIWARL